MDAHAYLLSQGWSGPGNPLNPSRRPGPHGGLGLTKPILVARKRNNHGLGKKTTHDHTNQWWLRGFETALKGIGDDGSATPRSDGSGSADCGTSELYRFFVKGPALEGTISRIEVKDVEEVKGGDILSAGSGKREKKRKRKLGDVEAVDEEEWEKNTALKKEKLQKKSNRDEQDSGEIGCAEDGQVAVESKKERRRRRKEKREKKEKVIAKSEEHAMNVRADKAQRKKQYSIENFDSGSPSQGEKEELNERDEADGSYDKKARKKQKKLEKEKAAQQELKHAKKESNRNEKKKRREKLP
ncbi:hypothetical protein ACJ72_00201 [Emergomyces africanus]|uniref:G-patch domain-containing protein n=1 Tax=Emergomyces africanus TaxID=1955775 RepID=A0A1B7P8R1_9EURO|nr:hypothetical protein ACJ72_00201 [Emergomyces africanus]